MTRQMAVSRLTPEPTLTNTGLWLAGEVSRAAPSTRPWHKTWPGMMIRCSAPSIAQPIFTIVEKSPTRAFSWLKAPTSAFTFKTLS